MPLSTRAFVQRTTHAGVLFVTVLGAVAALVLLGSGTAHAGGPTSVLIVSPENGITASAYASDNEYQLLTRALEEEPDADRGAPVDRILGPGGVAQVNVTWLIHDISVWRVDRIVLDAEMGVWINTQISWNGGRVDLERPGMWHRSPHPEELLALLGRWGMLDGTASAPVDSTSQPADDAVAPAEGNTSGSSNASGSTNTSGRTHAPEGTNPSGTSAPATAGGGDLDGWWPVLLAVVLGLVGGAFGRPVVDRLASRPATRTPEPPQQLIDA